MANRGSRYAPSNSMGFGACWTHFSSSRPLRLTSAGSGSPRRVLRPCLCALSPIVASRYPGSSLSRVSRLSRTRHCAAARRGARGHRRWASRCTRATAEMGVEQPGQRRVVSEPPEVVDTAGIEGLQGLTIDKARVDAHAHPPGTVVPSLLDDIWGPLGGDPEGCGVFRGCAIDYTQVLEPRRLLSSLRDELPGSQAAHTAPLTKNMACRRSKGKLLPFDVS